MSNWVFLVGGLSSVFFLLFLVFQNPKFGLWIALFAFIGLLGALIYREHQQHKSKGGHIDFHRIHSHQMSRYQEWMKQEHLDHDHALKSLIASIDRDLKLAKPGAALGAYLVVGPSGSGKSHLGQVVARALFGNSNVIRFDFKMLTEHSFIDQFQSMLATVHKNPYQLILLENLDQLDVSVLDAFLDILRDGVWCQESAPKQTSFAGCLFIATIAAAAPEGVVEESDEDKKRKWIEQLGLVDSRFISFCHGVYLWGELSVHALAEVASRKLVAYWKGHQIDLHYVSPQVLYGLLKEVKLHPGQGVHLLEPLIRKRSSKAIEHAIQHRLKRATLE